METTILEQEQILQIPAKEFNKILLHFKKLVKKNNSLPVLDNIYIRCSGGKLELIVSDMEVFIIYNTNLPKEFKFGFLVNFEQFYKVCKLQKNEIEINIFEHHITVNGAKIQYSLSPDEFIQIPTCDVFIQELSGLKTLFNELSGSLSKDELRPAMTGIYFDSENNNIVATDGYTLMYESIKEVDESFIIPAHATKCTISDNKCKLYKDKDKEFMKLNFDNVDIIFKPIDSIYPKWKKIVPINNDHINIKKSELMPLLDMAIINANKQTNMIIMEVRNNDLIISSDDVDYCNSYKGNIKIISTGKNIRFGVNGKFLKLLISNIQSDIKMSYSSATKGILINDNRLIMPMSIID